MTAARPWSLVDGGVTLAVRLTPKGGRDAIEGIETLADGRCVLKVRVRAAPSEGEANEAMRRLIARALAVPARDVTLATGASSRLKRLIVAGEGQKLIAALENFLR